MNKTKQQEEYEERLKAMLIIYEEVISGDDGFYSYWPKNSRGFLTSSDLRIIADFLDEKNEPRQKEIDEYFGKQRAEDQARLDPLGFNE
jgi:hypothetical protein